jgi:hypothetical protein
MRDVEGFGENAWRDYKAYRELLLKVGPLAFPFITLIPLIFLVATTLNTCG